MISHSRVDNINELNFMVCMTWTRASLTKQLTRGVAVFVHVCRQRVGTSSNCCDIISRPICDI